MKTEEYVYVVAVGIICLIVGFMSAPEYVSLEDWERTGFENRLDQQQADWETYADDLEWNLENQCDTRVQESVDRLTSRNKELIELNGDCVDSIADLKVSINDLNATISDFNLSDVNFWR